MTFEVFKYSVRGLYEKDKMTFTVLMALKIDMAGLKIKKEEFMTFVKGMLFTSEQISIRCIIFSRKNLASKY